MRTHKIEASHHGQHLLGLVTDRKRDLELRLAELQNSERQGTVAPQAIEEALALLEAILPADRDDVPPIVAEQLARWLESNRFIGVEPPPRRARG